MEFRVRLSDNTYLVKTLTDKLRTAELQSRATVFDSEDEAEKAAEDQGLDDYEIEAVPGNARKSPFV